MQKDVLFGLSQGTQVLQAIHKEMGGLEGVEKMMGDTEDARAYQEVRIPLTPIFPCEWCWLTTYYNNTGDQSHARWANVQPR